jgi:hypothetical protein
MAKTLDGLNLSNVLGAVREIPGVEVVEAREHPYKALAPGYRPCPIAKSTHVRRMLVPWLATVTGIQDKNRIYSALRSGRWFRQYNPENES